MKLKLKSFENYFLKWRKAHLSMSHLYYEKNNIKYCYVYIISHLPYMNCRL